MKFTGFNPALVDSGFISAPKRVEGKVLGNCRALVTEPAPRFVPIRPAEVAAVAQWYFNVRKQVEPVGGEMIFGWCIWGWPNVSLEVEHHCVWSINGEWIDVTPQPYHARDILFLSDRQRSYDFETRNRFNTLRIPIRRSSHTDEWLEATRLRLEIESAVPPGETRTLSAEESVRYNGCVKRARRAKAELLVELANRLMPSDL